MQAAGAGSPDLLASLVVLAMPVQIVLALRHASLRRMITPTVSGAVIMLAGLAAVPFNV